MQDFLLFFFKEKKNRDRQREILLQRSELCRGDTREMCFDGLLLGLGVLQNLPVQHTIRS
jgi:hypothetical protein